MKTKFLLPLCISVVMGAMVFISCEHEQNYSESIQNEEVNQFLQSSYGKDFLENFHFQIEDLNVEKLASLSQKNDVKLLCIPVTKNEKELGRLCVISNSQGRIFQALYEDWSEVNTEEGGMMKVFTTDHQYLATWTVTPEIDKFALKLTEVADVFDNGIDRVKTKTEFPANPAAANIAAADTMMMCFFRFLIMNPSFLKQIYICIPFAFWEVRSGRASMT